MPEIQYFAGTPIHCTLKRQPMNRFATKAEPEAVVQTRAQDIKISEMRLGGVDKKLNYSPSH